MKSSGTEKTINIRTWAAMTGFTVIIILLQLLGLSIDFGPFSVSLVLLPIVMGAALFGPMAGAWLGFVFGMVVLLSGDAAVFFVVDPFATVLVVLAKGILAGFAAGLIYKAFYRRSIVLASVLAAFLCPVVNSGLFLIGVHFFLPIITEWSSAMRYESVEQYIILELIGPNFLMELLLNLVFSPLILMLVHFGFKDGTWHISLSEKLYFLISWIILTISLLMVLGRDAITLRQVAFVLIVLVAASVFSVILMNYMVTKPLGMLANAAKNFGAGDTGYSKEDVISLPIRSHDEIADLYQEIRSMQNRIVDDTESLMQITAEREHIITELELASRIQASMLPNVFPPYPDRTEFDIYASMAPAKEVGGDFYDFFLIDEDHLGIVIADVSGKGIPAALFMMASKIIIAQHIKEGKSPAQILTDSNNDICGNNPMKLFVTVWVGILEISTGRLTATNAGHEYPVLKTPDGNFEMIKDKHGLVIGYMEGIEYKEYELLLEPGTKLFLYTDGVTEAMTAEDELFGLQRMLAALNREADAAPDQLLQNVRSAVDGFVKDVEQFDDLTMLCLEYKGPSLSPHVT